ncbi:acyl-CoA dehydrogenase family protein [Streptomyces sp. URMC 129]|uniref:acyl-CoA dehydrogenase family protein n=1 Tax=Streptomyces sp. URMC 129 TaxID=3423407 RepID=UPI003F1C7ED0
MSQFATELRTLIDDLVTVREDAADSAEALELWNTLRELELPRIGIPDERGGAGGALDDLLVVVDALAAHGVGVPVVEASVADWTLSHAHPLGEELSTIALLAEAVDATAGPLTAELRAVPWARHADRLVLCAPGSPTLAVDLRHPSVTVRAGENLAGEPRDTVTLAGTPAVPVAGAPDAQTVRARLALLWSTAVVGAARGAHRLTRTYVSERHQFGAPLLRIPAVAGGLALMRVHLLQAEAALAHAREEADDTTSPDRAAAAVAVARITTAAAATEVARLAHQLHGAMGITREYPLHRYTRRLWAWRDAVAGEHTWSGHLGRQAAALGEETVWTELTSTGW